MNAAIKALTVRKEHLIGSINAAELRLNELLDEQEECELAIEQAHASIAQIDEALRQIKATIGISSATQEAA